MEPSQTTAAAAGAIGIGLFIGFAVIGVISLICWIKVLIALFKKEGAGLGILGILCNLFAFIWGWLKASELGLKKTMIWWTLCIVAAVVLGLAGSLGMAGVALSDPAIQKQMEEAQRNAERQMQEQQAQPAPAPAPTPAPAPQ